MKTRCWMTYVAVSVFLLPVCVVCAQEAEKKPSPPSTDARSSAGRLQLGATEWNFGQVWYGEDIQTKIELLNAGTGTLKIGKVTSSCGCTPVNKETVEGAVLAPGEKVMLGISYNTRKKTGTINQTVTIMSDDPVLPAALIAVKGDVKALYELQPPEGLLFSRVGRDSVETKKVRLINKYEKPLALKLRPAPSGAFDFQLQEIEAGKVWELTATTKPPLAAQGAAQTEAVLETGVAQVPEIKVRTYALVVPPVAVSRTELYVPKNMPRPTEQMLRVNYLGTPIRITNVKASLDAIKTEILPSSANPPQGQTYGWYDIKVLLPQGDEIPDGGAAIEIETDAREPEYAKFTVKVTNHPPQGLTVRPPAVAHPSGSNSESSPAKFVGNDAKTTETGNVINGQPVESTGGDSLANP